MFSFTREKQSKTISFFMLGDHNETLWTITCIVLSLFLSGFKFAGLFSSKPNDDSSKPVANSQSVSTPEDSPKKITLTGTDPNGDTLKYEIVTSPQHGTLSGKAPNVRYIPTKNFNGSDSFTFKVKDAEIFSEPAMR